jgi:hypothetical protein
MAGVALKPGDDLDVPPLFVGGRQLDPGVVASGGGRRQGGAFLVERLSPHRLDLGVGEHETALGVLAFEKEEPGHPAEARPPVVTISHEELRVAAQLLLEGFLCRFFRVGSSTATAPDQPGGQFVELPLADPPEGKPDPQGSRCRFWPWDEVAGSSIEPLALLRPQLGDGRCRGAGH